MDTPISCHIDVYIVTSNGFAMLLGSLLLLDEQTSLPTFRKSRIKVFQTFYIMQRKKYNCEAP